MQSQPNYWWEVKKHSKGSLWRLAGTFIAVAVLIVVVSIGSAAGSNAPGYIGYGVCCSLPFLLIAAPFVLQLRSRNKRDRQAAAYSRQPHHEPEDDADY